MPPAIGSDADYPDYVTNLMLTVLDLQLPNVIVSNAITYYRLNRWDEVRTLENLESTLARFPNDRDGNRAAAAYLWRYQYGDRLGRLRGLADWVRRRGLVDQQSLKAWAYESRLLAGLCQPGQGLRTRRVLLASHPTRCRHRETRHLGPRVRPTRGWA
jgi:hypothetical protein